MPGRISDLVGSILPSQTSSYGSTDEEQKIARICEVYGVSRERAMQMLDQMAGQNFLANSGVNPDDYNISGGTSQGSNRLADALGLFSAGGNSWRR